MVDLPEDPTSFEGLERANPHAVIVGPNWAAYERDPLTAEEREAWDARAKGLGGEISTNEQSGRTYYLVPELPEDAA